MVDLQAVLTHCARTINHMASIICSYLPFYFFEIGEDWLPDFERPTGLMSAEFLIWPLEVVRNSNAAGTYRATAREALNWIATNLGMRPSSTSPSGGNDSPQTFIDEGTSSLQTLMRTPSQLFDLNDQEWLLCLLIYVEETLEIGRAGGGPSVSTLYRSPEKVRKLAIILLRNDIMKVLKKGGGELCQCAEICDDVCVRRILLSIARGSAALSVPKAMQAAEVFKSTKHRRECS